VLISQQEVVSLGHVSRIGTEGARCKDSDIRIGVRRKDWPHVWLGDQRLDSIDITIQRQDTPTPNGQDTKISNEGHKGMRQT
jgi:hypothetical protein